MKGERVMFNGYCFLQAGGKYLPAVTLNDAEAAWAYVMLHKDMYAEVRVVYPLDDSIAIKAINGQVVFPTPEDIKEYTESTIHDRIGALISGLKGINNGEVKVEVDGDFVRCAEVEALAIDLLDMNYPAVSILTKSVLKSNGFTFYPGSWESGVSEVIGCIKTDKGILVIG